MPTIGGEFTLAQNISRTMKDLIKGAIYSGLLYLVVNTIAIGLFNLSGITLVAINILPTVGAIVIMLHAFDKI